MASSALAPSNKVLESHRHQALLKPAQLFAHVLNLVHGVIDAIQLFAHFHLQLELFLQIACEIVTRGSIFTSNGAVSLLPFAVSRTW